MIDQKIRKFETNVFWLNLLFLGGVLLIGFLWFGDLYLSTSYGFLMGLFSFHILVRNIKNLDIKAKRSMLGALGLSGVKVFGLLFFVWLLFKFGVKLTPVIAGLLLSQMAVVFATFASLYNEKMRPDKKGEIALAPSPSSVKN